MRIKLPLILFCLAAFTVGVSYAQNKVLDQQSIESEYNVKQKLEKEEENNRTVKVGDYEITREDREGFGARLSQLLWVGHDNLKAEPGKAINGQKPYKKHDIEARKKYFSEEGWAQYLTYLAEQRALLKQLGVGHMAASCTFLNAPSQYSEASQKRISFATEGSSFYTSQDNWCGTGIPSRHFNLDVTFLPVKPDAPDNFVIDKWELQFCGANDLSCLYRNAVRYRNSEIATPPLNEAQVEGKSIVLEKSQSDALTSRVARMIDFPKVAAILPSNGEILVHSELNNRKKYFSEFAWKQFIGFAYTKTINTFCEASNSAVTDFKVKKVDDKNFQLSVNVAYSDRSAWRNCNNGMMKIQSTIERKGGSYQDFIFTSWQAKICNEVGEKCEDYQKISSQFSELEANRSTQSYLLKSLFEWGKRTPLDHPLNESGDLNSLDDRKKFFNQETWSEYQKYIDARNSAIIGRYLVFHYSPDSQSFENGDLNEIIFSAKGIYADVGPTADQTNNLGSFEASIAFQKTGETAADIVITKWRMVMRGAQNEEKEVLKKLMPPH